MRTVRELAEARSEDPADVAAGMIEKPDSMLKVLRRNMELLEEGLATAKKLLAGSRKASAGATQAVDILRAYVAEPAKHLADTANLVHGAVQKAIK